MLNRFVTDLTTSGTTIAIKPTTIPRKTIADSVTDKARSSFFLPLVLLNLFENSFSTFTIIGFIKNAMTSPQITGMKTVTIIPRKLVIALNLSIATTKSTFIAMTSAA